MKHAKYLTLTALFLGFTTTAALAGNGFMGGSGTIKAPAPTPVEQPAATTSSTTSTTPCDSSTSTTDGASTTDESPTTSDTGSTTDGPLNDNMSESGKLFGDLYVIDRYVGVETKRVPAVDADGNPVMITGDWIDENGKQVINPATGTPYQVEQQAWTTAPAIGGEPKLTEGFARYTVVNEDTGEYEINPLTNDIYFAAPYPSQCVQPVADAARWGDISSKTHLPANHLPMVITYDSTWERTECEVQSTIFLKSGETWNGVTYYKDIYYTDLIQAVDFGRLNLGRAPDAVLEHAFDEAIRNINNAKSIELDASGRLVLTTDIYDQYLTNPDGTPLYLETVTKPIDSALENVALYIKLMKDGHLITPADERAAIDRSLNGGIPLWKLLELEDGPSQSLRPTIDIAKMIYFGLGSLVDASNITTYWTMQDADGNLIVSLKPCDGCTESYGITTRSPLDTCRGEDFAFGATFVASAADKDGSMTMDKIVYLNSILGINLVVGYSAYDENGEPVPGAISYAKNPVYFDFSPGMGTYHRQATFANRGQVTTPAGDGNPALYDGKVRVLVADPLKPGTWVEREMPIFQNVFGDGVTGQDYSGTNISGFTAMADDDLKTISYIHTFQIPALR